MFLWDLLNSWLEALLSLMGLREKKATLLLLGLDNAGKTTLLYKLKTGTNSSFAPTQRAHVEEIVVGNLSFHAWDLGGHEALRMVWSEFYGEADAILFLVDTADPNRLEEAGEELRDIMEEPMLKDVPIAVLGNKMDIKESIDRNALISALKITVDPQKLQVFRCSVTCGWGYKETFEWLSSIL